MKFAENNRISHRQLYRQMILTFLAPFLVCLPGKNGIQGMNGFWSVVLAVAVLILYVFILLRVTSGYSGTFSWKFLGADVRGLFSCLYHFYRSIYSENTGTDHTEMAAYGNPVRVDIFSCDSCVQYRNRKGNSEKRTDGGDIRRPASGRCSSYDGAVSGTDTG